MNTDRIRCSEVLERLPLYTGGDLDPGVLEAVRAHLTGCAGCARLAAGADGARRELLAAFRALETPRPELWPAIRAQLRVEGLIRASDVGAPQAPRPVLRSVPPRRRSWTLVLTPLVAAAAVLAIVQLSGFFVAPAAVPGQPVVVAPPVGSGSPGPEVVVTPVSAPGGLERVDPSEGLFPQKYRRALRPGPVPGEVSSASYLPRESR